MPWCAALPLPLPLEVVSRLRNHPGCSSSFSVSPVNQHSCTGPWPWRTGWVTAEWWHSCSTDLCLLWGTGSRGSRQAGGQGRDLEDVVGGRGEKQLVPACEIPCEILPCPTMCLLVQVVVPCPRDGTECPEQARGVRTEQALGHGSEQGAQGGEGTARSWQQHQQQRSNEGEAPKLQPLPCWATEPL